MLYHYLMTKSLPELKEGLVAHPSPSIPFLSTTSEYPNYVIRLYRCNINSQIFRPPYPVYKYFTPPHIPSMEETHLSAKMIANCSSNLISCNYNPLIFNYSSPFRLQKPHISDPPRRHHPNPDEIPLFS